MNTRNRTMTVFSIAAVAMVSLVLTATSANADLVVEEQYIYTAGLIDTQNGGTGFDGAWVSTKSHGQDYQTGITVHAVNPGPTLNDDAGLFFSNLSVGGSALSRFGCSGRAQANRTISAASQTALLGDNTTMWFSVLIGEPLNNNQGSFLFGTEQFSTDIPQVLAAAGDGFGITVANVGTFENGTGTINAIAFDGNTTPIGEEGSFTPNLPGGANFYDTSLIVGKINWKANGTPDELFLFNVTDLQTEPAEGAAIASITNLDFDQSAFDTVAMWDTCSMIQDEIRLGNSFADVTPEIALLTLQVNTVSGGTTILGHPDNNFDINFYEITSSGNSLDVTGWSSLFDQNMSGFPVGTGSGNGWEEAGGVGSHALAEGYLLGNSTIDANASISLGTGYDEGVDDQNLNFTYRTDTGQLFQGLVEYITEPTCSFTLLGDANNDNQVLGNDLTAAKQNFGTVGSDDGCLLGDANDDGQVIGNDITAVKQNFLNVFPASAHAAASAVPETSAMLLRATGAAGLGAWRRRRAG